ncbi:MAG: 1-acyl-sn-glycerol-3-phosphate acyltransferase [Sphaerochaetaceae bacterium]
MAKEVICFKKPTPSKGFTKPKYSEATRKFVRLAGPLYLRFVEGVKSVNLLNPHQFISHLENFHKNEQRLILVFRHAAKEDAPVLTYALNNKLSTKKFDAHAQFIYGSDVLNWAPKIASFIFPRLGSIPVQNRSSNKEGLSLLRQLVQNGNFPIALAPEGQVSYHMYNCSEISSGSSSLASWALETSNKVAIVPIAISYRHSSEGLSFIRLLLKKWVSLTNIELGDIESSPVLSLLEKATIHTIQLLETFYKIKNSEDNLHIRILHICEKIMSQAEFDADLQKDKSMLDRLFVLRFKGLNSIYVPNFNRNDLSVVEQNVADYEAVKAHLYLRDSQVVDVLQYINPTYIKSPCSIGRATEYALNLLDVLNRLSWGNIDSRYSPKKKEAYVYFGDAVEIAKDSLPSRKETLNFLNKEIFAALQKSSENLEPLIETQFIEN